MAALLGPSGPATARALAGRGTFPLGALASPLVGYWPLDTAPGNVTPDLSGNANNGTLRNGAAIDPTQKAPISGNVASVHLPGASGDYVDVPDSPSLQLTSSFSLAAWIYTTAVGPGGGNQQGILEKWGGASQGGAFLRLSSTNHVVFAIFPATGATVSIGSSATISVNTWHYVAATFDATSGTMTIYIDGNPDGTITGAPKAAGSTSDLRIGDDYGANLFTGNIDEARVYTSALTQTQIQDLINPQPAPTHLTATPGPNQALLQWTAPTGATSYIVLRGTASGGPYSTVVASGITTTSFTDTTVVFPATYYYVVEAVGPNGTSGPSNEASCSPFQPVITVSPVQLVVVEGGGLVSFQVKLSQAPTADVRVPVTVDPGNGTSPYPVLVSQGTGIPAASITLDSNTLAGSLSWTVLVTGQDDQIANNPRSFTIHVGPSQSSEAFFSNVTCPDVTGTQSETDVAGFLISPPGGLVAVDGGPPVSFMIQPATQPRGTVVVDLALSNSQVVSLTTVGPLSFDSSNWKTAVPVTVTPMDDKGANPSLFFAVTSFTVVLTVDR
ncbi:MAG TPA: LamG domain-containing protein, partial [Planctomycetota bacterium]|nr:LamG domain-containing protein [Planctomycetota bacterium]